TAPIAAAAVLWSAVGIAQRVDELPVPWYSLPVEIVEGPDGAMWFSDWSSIGRVDPSGAMTSFLVDVDIGLRSVTKGPDGNLWFTGALYQQGGRSIIGRLTTSGSVTTFPLPDGRIVGAIASGPDGSLWFLYGSAIGRITTSGVVTEFPVPSSS